MNYAIIENGSVVNTIVLNSANAAEFPEAVSIDGRPVAIGDAYTDGQFMRGGEAVLSDAERIAALEAALAEIEEALAV